MTKILIVDDEESDARTLALGLRLEGFEVDLAHDAETALSVLEARPADVVLVDLMLPRTNGIELARRLRSAHPRLRVMLTSPYQLSEGQLVRTDCGAVGFVVKPCPVAEVASFIRRKIGSADGCLLATG